LLRKGVRWAWKRETSNGKRRENFKFQNPNIKETSSPKAQIDALMPPAGAWILRVEASLKFGLWILKFPQKTLS
jgi:hypothetical protein